jgi:hypothetical protein
MNCLSNAFSGPQEAPLSCTGLTRLHQFNYTNGQMLKMEQMLAFHSSDQIRNTMWSWLPTSTQRGAPL